VRAKAQVSARAPSVSEATGARARRGRVATFLVNIKRLHPTSLSADLEVT
jgi:hypothetical protein